jgi:predicted nucleic acid-binding protein
MRAPVTVLDACVLYPAALRDLMMRMTVAGLIDARWTSAIHEEWINALLRERSDLKRFDLDRIRDLMDCHAEGCLVIDYDRHIPGLNLPDPDDRHVVAAAIEADADWIVTWNLRDFPQSTLRNFGLSAITPDQLLLQLLEKRESETRRVIKETRLSLKNPEKSAQEYLVTLRKQGLVGFCDAIGSWTEEL